MFVPYFDHIGVMNISEALTLQYKNAMLVAFVGAGGKTTCMFRLANELRTRGMRVIVTTTTKIWHPEVSQYDRLIIQSESKEVLKRIDADAWGTITVAAKSVLKDVGKLKGFAPEVLDKILWNGLADYILVEADGSRNKPVKAPAKHEPVIPESAELVIGLTGFDCYGKAIDSETVFRVNEFCKVVRKLAGETIDAEVLLALLRSENGLFKAVPANARKVWLLNKADNKKSLQVAEQVSQYILSQNIGLDAVILGALNQKEPIKKILTGHNDRHMDMEA